MEPLINFEKKTYSQHGEDGIVQEVLKRISKHRKLDLWCVEFGAWDGVKGSNTCRLIREENYSAVLIEGDKKRAQQLNSNFPQPNVHKICRFVNFEGKNTLEKILSETPLPLNFDFLSIDIDGVDFHVFESLNLFRPKIICIEFNHQIPNAVNYVQKKDFSIKQGSSAKALLKLANDKDYSLVAVTGCNMIIVSNDLKDFVLDSEASLEELNTQGNNPTYIFSGYDGSIMSNKEHIFLGWHGVPVQIKKLQFLPKPLRKFYGDYGVIRWTIFAIYVAISMPSLVWKHRIKVTERLKRVLKFKFHIDLQKKKK